MYLVVWFCILCGDLMISRVEQKMSGNGEGVELGGLLAVVTKTCDGRTLERVTR